MTTEAETRNPEEAGGLRRELRFWEAIALSIAIMAPTAAMALNGTVPPRSSWARPSRSPSSSPRSA
jgi:hypothetical protein